MYKKLIPIIIILLVLGMTFSRERNKQEILPEVVDNRPMATDVLFSFGSHYCFVYSHEATEDAPYAVTEHLVLSRVRDQITGTKIGTQSGPDMTNGYEGTFDGKLVDGGFEGTFAYTIEGSAQKEFEVYKLTNTTLEKMRYPLVEQKGVLMPDQTKDFKVISYTNEKCAE